MEACIFCDVIARKVPGYFVLEEENVVAFLDIFGSAPGHCLVVPIKHGESILDYSNEELGQVMGVVKKIAGKIEKTMHTDSITIGINHKEEKGVHHLHVHLIPRFKNDHGGIIQTTVKRKIDEPLEKIAEKLRNA